MFANYRSFVTKTRAKNHWIFNYFTSQQYFSALRVVFQAVTNREYEGEIIKTQKRKKNNEICSVTYIPLQIPALLYIYYKS